MTEKEKMLNGILYDGGDPELIEERAQARELVHEFNNALPGEREKRDQVIRKLFARTGRVFHIEPRFQCDYGSNIEVGENFYANFGCVILDVNKVTIGDNVLFGPNVQVYTAGHPVDPEERLTMLEYGKAIAIGDNVWIGGAAIICPGVTIGSNSTIGAGSVVTKNIPANVVAAGNPCRVIRAV